MISGNIYTEKLKSVFKSFSILVLITLFTLIVSFATFSVSPIVTAILIAPLLLIILWKFPDTHSPPPLDRIRLIFTIWLVLSIIWPYYLVINLPGLGSVYPVRLLLIFVIFYTGFYLLKSPTIKSQVICYFSTYRLAFFLLFTYLALQFIASFFVGTFEGAPYLFSRQMFEVFIPLLFVLFLFNSKEKVISLFNMLFYVSVIVVLIGLFEAVFNKGFYSTFVPATMLSEEEFVLEAIEDKVRNGFRVQSVFGHPLVLAQYLVLTFPLFLYKFMVNKNLIFKLTVLILIVFLLFVVLRTESRAALGALFIQGLVFLILVLFFILKEKRVNPLGWLFLLISPLLIVGAIVIALLSQDLLIGQSPVEMSSAYGRLVMLEKAVNIFMNQPVHFFTGFGSGLAAVTLGYYSPNGNLTIDSFLLTVILESGIFGLLLFVFFFIYHIFLGIKLYLRNDDIQILAIAIVIGLIGYLVISITSSRPENLRLIYIYALSTLILTYQTYKVSSKLNKA